MHKAKSASPASPASPLARFLPAGRAGGPAEGVDPQAPPPRPDGADAERESADELSEIQVASRRVEAMMRQENAGEYYACLVFPSDAHRTAFMDGLARLSPALRLDADAMLDGLALARALRIALPPAPPAHRFRTGGHWARHVATELLPSPDHSNRPA